MEVGAIISAQTTAQRTDHQHEKNKPEPQHNYSFMSLKFILISDSNLSISLSCSYLDPWASSFHCLCFQCLFGFCAPALMTKLWLGVRIAGLSSAQRCSTLSSPTQRAPLPLLGPLLKSRVAMGPHGNHCVPYRRKVYSQTERERERETTSSHISIIDRFINFQCAMLLWRYKQAGANVDWFCDLC